MWAEVGGLLGEIVEYYYVTLLKPTLCSTNAYMGTRTHRNYGVSAGIMLASTLAEAGLYVFTTEEATTSAPEGIEPRRVPYLLKALADSGWIIRLCRGLYAGTGKLPGR